MAINLAGYLYSDNGSEIGGATIKLFDSGGNEEASTTTASSGTVDQSDSTKGKWTFAEADEDVYDIEITQGSQIRRIKGADKIQLSEIDVRNNAAATTPAFTFTNYAPSVTSHQVGRFRSLNTTRADGDEIYLSFNLVNDNAEETEFARITAEANDVSNNSEDGEIRFSVMKAGTLTDVWTLDSSTTGATAMDMNVDSFTIGSSTDGTDITLTFDGTTSDGVITWMEDEDYFAFSDEILMNTTEKIHLRDTAIYINSSTDGQLDLVADTEIQIAATTIDINGAVALDGAITGATNITLSGELDAATLDISGNADIDGTLEADAYTVDGTALNEYIADTVGAMTTSNTETGITITYQDADNTIDFVVGTLNQDTTGTAAIATAVTITDNESTDEDNAIIFTSGGDVDGGNIGLESDGNLTYNPSTGRLTATQLAGAIQTASQTAITGVGTITTGTWNGTAIASTYIAADAITGAKIADDAIGSEHIADDAVVSAAIADNAITNALMADDAIDSAEIADGAVDLAHMSSESVDEDNLHISNSGSNGQFLSRQSGNSGGLTWATPSATATALDDIAAGDAAANLYTTVGNITIDAQANDADVIIKVDDNGSAVTAVTFDGSDEGNAIFVNDVQLKSDGALLEFGADLDTTLTHTDGTGLTLNSTNKLAFGDTGTFIHQSSDGVLTIESDTTVDINGAVVFNGALSGITTIGASGVITANAGVVVDNITIDGTEIDLSTGDLTLDVAGDIILDAGGVNVLPGADNTHDLGAAATRWKTVYGQQFHMDASADGIASHDYAGMSMTVRVGDGADVGAFDLVCISDVTNEVQIADASTYALSRVIGINPSNSAISDNAEGTILLFGIVRDDSWGWTTGQTLYLSETAGDITATAPTTSGAFVTAIGVALEPDMIYFNPSPAVIEVA